MTDKLKIFATILAVAVVSAIGFMFLGGILGYHRAKAQYDFQPPKVDTVFYTDTIKIPADDPVINDSVVNTDPFPLPVASNDTCWVHDTCLVYVNIDHHFTNIPGVADIWHSGFQAKIDSMRFYQQTTTITNTVFQTEYKMPRLTLDVGGGGFYCDERINPYLIGKMAYNAPKTTFAAFGAINHEGSWAVGLNVTYRFTLIK